jgi:hypothetical protein
MFRKMVLFALFALVMVVGVSAVMADDSSDNPKPVFNDGRLNAFDAGAPIALYYTYDEQHSVASDGSDVKTEVLSGVEALAWDNQTGTSSLALNATVDQINQVTATCTSNCVVAESNGYTLNYSASGWLWVTTPADSEGKTYSFQWQKLW